MMNGYHPDHATAPGTLLRTYLEEDGMSRAELARCCGCSARLISGILSGKAGIEPRTALRLERVFHVKADMWLRMEADYQLRRIRPTERTVTDEEAQWASSFPVNEMVKRGCLPRPESTAELIASLLTCFRVGSVAAWKDQPHFTGVAFRHSPSFASDKQALATWLQLGRIEAAGRNCAEYGKERFKEAIGRIRGLSRTPIRKAVERAGELCNEAGVALVIVPPFPRTPISGAARWFSSRKALTQPSTRHKTDDHLWFGFFREAAHILRHGTRFIHADDGRSDDDAREREADEWAANILVPRRDWKCFVAKAPHNSGTIDSFAREQGVAPGIVVGRLQHEGILPWNTSLDRFKPKVDLGDGRS